MSPRPVHFGEPPRSVTYLRASRCACNGRCGSASYLGLGEMPFIIENIEFKRGSATTVRFRVVPPDRDIQYGSGSFQYIEVPLSSDLDLKEAIAIAAENAA